MAVAICNLTETSPQDQIAILRGILQRIAQAEHPEGFSIVKQVLLERLRELEEEAAFSTGG
jgi:hypothetical protein